MTASFKLIASDLDGTLFAADHALAPRTIRAVQAAHDAGIRVVAATGRSSISTTSRLRPAGVISMAICSNGSLVHDIDADRTVHRFPIEHAHVQRVFDIVGALDPKISFSWETDHGNGWDNSFADIAFAHEDLGAEPTLLHRPDEHQLTTKLMVSHPHIIEGELIDFLRPHLHDDVSVSTSGVDFVEITGVGVNKATGLAHLCAQWQILPSEVVAFGDNYNDLDMLRWAGHGVAMSNAVDAAQDAADEVIGHHDDDAVAQFIEKLLNT